MLSYRFINIFISLITLMIISSCVGVIETTETKTNKSSAANTTAKFEGIYDGKAIGHSKIEIRFRPATGGSGNFSYHAFANDMPQPIEAMIGKNVILDHEGFIRMVIDNLDYNSSYSFSVKVRDLDQQRYDDNQKILTFSTFSYYVPEFSGVTSVSAAAGIAGMTSIVVNWNQAIVPTVIYGDPFSVEHNVSGYNVYYAKSVEKLFEMLNLEEQHFFTFVNNSTNGVVTADSSVLSKTITGLSVNSEYFISVRARQSSNPPKYELNSVVASTSTLKEVPVEFAGIVSAVVPIGLSGFSQINVGWSVAAGAAQYNFYVKPMAEDTGVIHPNYDSEYLVATETNISATSKALINTSLIQPAKDYAVYVVACKDATCGWNGSSLSSLSLAGQAVRKTVSTVPPIAPFSESISSEILNLEQPDGVSGLSSLKLSWSLLDLSKGYYSEVRIYQVLNKLLPIESLTSANLRLVPRDITATPPYVDPTKTELLTVNNSPVEAIIGGLTLDTEYCFIALPILSGNGIAVGQEISLMPANFPTYKCATPTYKEPVFGVNSLMPTCEVADSGENVTIRWTLPEESNIITNFEVWYTTNASFAFDGVNGAWQNGLGDYVLEASGGFVNATESSTVIHNLSPSTSYIFGVNAYYKPANDDPIRSIPSIAMATVSCQTPEPEMIHGGWTKIISIGPRSDRLGTVFPEVLTTDYRQVKFDAAGASHGIVRLGWNDFTLADTNPFVKPYDFYASGIAGLGYYVYRLKVQSVADMTDVLDSDHAKWDPANSNVDLLTFVPVDNGNGQMWWEASSAGGATSLLTFDYMWPNGSLYSFEIIDYPPEHGVTYFYKVVAVFNNVPTKFYDPDLKGNIVRVIIPNNNEALVHRWMANLDICSQMGRGFGDTCTDAYPEKCVDIENDYRCQFNGFGSVDQFGIGYGNTTPAPEATRYMDQEYDVIFDRFEMGCKITKTNCTISAVPGLDCMGNNTPAALGVTVDSSVTHTVFYDYTGGGCYVWRAGGSAWEDYDSFDATVDTAIKPGGANIGQSVYTNAAMEIPLGKVGVRELEGTCESISAPALFPGDTTHMKRLKRRKWDMAARQWPEQMSDTTVYDLEAAVGAVGCNTDLGYGINGSFAASAINIVQKIIRTGSMGTFSTEKCTSKYGIQDPIGNVSEHYSDAMYDEAVATNGVNWGYVSVIDTDNDDFLGVKFDGVIASLGGYVNVSPYFNYVLGIPLVCASGCDVDDMAVPDVGTTAAQIRNDYNYVDNGNDAFYMIMSDDYYAGWNTANRNGFYTFSLYRFRSQAGSAKYGGRCAYKVPND